ncbi:hypothetical protein AB0F77_09710 [Streptomyces sp. NPDC026672]|uniref:hypothetical protein n=1 Tax=unclassified Streptomyces TaxID=2593676 RepID=UPI0033C42E94
MNETDNKAAETTIKDRLVVFLGAGTVENVPAAAREVPFALPPRARNRPVGGDTGAMKLSRPVSWFLLVFGVWSWVIWVTFY